VLPAATWYEKADLNSTDLHSFIHPLSAAVPPCWESKSDWQIFKALAKKVSELAGPHFAGPVNDLIAAPLAHDTAAEIAQPSIRDWSRGEVDAVPGTTMPAMRVVSRDYRHLHDQFVSFGPLVRANGLTAHGTQYDVVMDNVANRGILEVRRVLKPQGKLIIIGGGGPEDSPWFYAFKAPLKALFVSWFVDQDMAMYISHHSGEDLATIARLMQEGKVMPVIDRTYPLAETAEAMTYLETGRARGKVVVVMEPGPR
jgi:anaerobic selenocysteine-containing dehydrogenase